MQHTEEQKAEFKREFAKKQRWQIILITLILVVVLPVKFFSGWDAVVFGIPLDVAGLVAVVLMLGVLVFSLYAWRCPACNGYLGNPFSSKFCRTCGVALS